MEIEEQTARVFADVIRSIVSDLGHDLTDPEVRRVVRLRLTETEPTPTPVGAGRRWSLNKFGHGQISP